ncbi:nucleoside deaminase [Persephonella atlantica]|uniref:nucleoside deaminase n=1 Tax=Persephonella atlantica TaxID=2699429 RepID=UPI0030844448
MSVLSARKKDELFLEEAYLEALKAYSLDEVPVGAVVVIDGKIVGRGFNRRITSSSAVSHAEIVAIEEACKKVGKWRLDGATLYVTNEPCLMCAGAVMQSRISRVVFGSLNEKTGAVISKFRVFDEKDIPFKVKYDYVEHKKSKDILKEFFTKKRGHSWEG